MEFTVGIIHGENHRFAARTSWPSTKLTVEPGQLALTTGFKSILFEKAMITRLSEYGGFCWLFASGIRVEHNRENCPPFFVFWTFDLTQIKRSLSENGYALSKNAEE
jgi:hypothetical protein